MASYENGKDVLLKKRPEPGRIVEVPKPKEEVQQVNTDAIAAAVIEAITKRMPSMIIRETVQGSSEIKEVRDNFDNSKSMEKLAEAMSVQRGNSESNFEDLGRVKNTVKNKEEVDKTIDLLKNIGD